MNFSVETNGDKILNFELMTVTFCMGPTIMYCLELFKEPKNTFQED